MKDIKDIKNSYIGLRVTSLLLGKIDSWAKLNDIDRSEAIRKLLSSALA